MRSSPLMAEEHNIPNYHSVNAASCGPDIGVVFESWLKSSSSILGDNLNWTISLSVFRLDNLVVGLCCSSVRTSLDRAVESSDGKTGLGSSAAVTVLLRAFVNPSGRALFPKDASADSARFCGSIFGFGPVSNK